MSELSAPEPCGHPEFWKEKGVCPVCEARPGVALTERFICAVEDIAYRPGKETVPIERSVLRQLVEEIRRSRPKPKG